MRRVGLACLCLWFAAFGKVGLGLLFGVEDYVDRVRVFPHLVVRGDPTSDYKNWSILPLALGRTVGADSVRTFAALQCVVLVAGTIAVLGGVARRRPEMARLALVGLFATMLPSWLLISAGSYDQLLALLLLAATLVERPALALVAGVLLGVTHAEAATVAVLGLAFLSAARIGPRLGVRLWTLAGIGIARAALTVWFRIAGQADDRVSFVSDLGVRTPLRYLADTWPVVLWSAACGGWLIVADFLHTNRQVRVRAAVLVALGLNLAAAAITVDQSRVIMLTTMPIVVALAAFGPVPGHRETRSPVLRSALVIGVLAPVTVSWVGAVAVAGDPLHVGW